MIACTHSLMGGCFAQNSSGAAVETYWPALLVDIPRKEGGFLLYVPFPGGDSEDDEMQASCYYETVCESPEKFNVQIGIGSYNPIPNVYEGGWCLRPAEGRDNELFYNGSRATVADINGWVYMHAQGGLSWIYCDDGEYSVTATDYLLDMQAMRSIGFRYWHIRQFAYMCYSNKNTGVKWFVCPMRGTNGLTAIWENWTGSLVEL